MIAELLTCLDASSVIPRIQSHYRKSKSAMELLDKRSGFTDGIAKELFDIAMDCTDGEIEERPNMSHVLEVLQRLTGEVVRVLS